MNGIRARAIFIRVDFQSKRPISETHVKSDNRFVQITPSQCKTGSSRAVDKDVV